MSGMRSSSNPSLKVSEQRALNVAQRKLLDLLVEGKLDSDCMVRVFSEEHTETPEISQIDMFSEGAGRLSIPLSTENWAVFSKDRDGEYRLSTGTETHTSHDFMALVVKLAEIMEVEENEISHPDC